ncbi:hypothetical protein P691DRAFT_81867 [Macrolepiota fuliginosa MF-IS2]|uniref:Uncharacterized protein n=1 Tax=Macrolepiota fuliginosa MF-IS2 TaxID=1400762 RepID=A0A9P6C9K3_9AGAR|nr:hypothetical protein P691DRAFT_81867 [Macrolepiota fuliginosa MF-IS2]
MSVQTRNPDFQPGTPGLAAPQCRLRRIQTTLRPVPPVPILPPQPTVSPPPSSAAAIHTKPDTQSPATDTDAQSDPSPFLSASVVTQQPAYPFPPPGLSKPSAATATPSDMITPELEASSCTPRELELKSDLLASTTTAHSSDSDASIWGTFQMESFLGNYCHTSSKPFPSPPFHGDNEDGTGTQSDSPPASITPSPNLRSSPPALSPSHWNRLLKGPASGADTALTTLSATTHPTTNTTTQSPSSILSPHPHRSPFSPRTQVNLQPREVRSAGVCVEFPERQRLPRSRQ